MLPTLLLDPDLSKLAPFILGGLALAVVLPVLLIWALSKHSAQKELPGDEQLLLS